MRKRGERSYSSHYDARIPFASSGIALGGRRATFYGITREAGGVTGKIVVLMEFSPRIVPGRNFNSSADSSVLAPQTRYQPGPEQNQSGRLRNRRLILEIIRNGLAVQGHG